MNYSSVICPVYLVPDRNGSICYGILKFGRIVCSYYDLCNGLLSVYLELFYLRKGMAWCIMMYVKEV